MEWNGGWDEVMKNEEKKEGEREEKAEAARRSRCVLRLGGVLVELSLWREDDDGDLGVAEDGDLVRLLEEAIAALGEGHLPVDLVLYPLQLHLAAPHRRRQTIRSIEA